MGGGAQYLGVKGYPVDSDSCLRTDGRNLIKDWQKAHPEGRAVNSTEDLMSIDIANTSHILGVFAPNHMPYHAVKSAETPSLSNMTMQAIKLLKKNKNGFLLMVSNPHLNHIEYLYRSQIKLRTSIMHSMHIEVILMK